MSISGISLFCICGCASLICTQAVCGQTELGDPKRTPTPASPLGYRGDGGNRFTGATPPETWDAIKGDNVRWRVKLPSRKAAWDAKGNRPILFTGSAQPVAFGDRVYATAAPATLVCLQAMSGEEGKRYEVEQNARRYEP